MSNVLTNEQLDDMMEELLGSKAKMPEDLEDLDVPDFEEEAVTDESGKTYRDLVGWDEEVLTHEEDGEKQENKNFVVETFDHTKDVPELDPYRVIDHSVTYPFFMAMQSKFKDMKVLLVGPTGCGKTTLVEHYCAVVNKPFFRINGRLDMESDSLFGKAWVDPDKGMRWTETGFIHALKNGYMILIDEAWKIPPGIWMTLQRLLERGGVLQIDDMPDGYGDNTIVPHPETRIVLADNVVGTGDGMHNHAATLIQDVSTLNRIDLVIRFPYLKPEQEEKLISAKFPSIVTTKDGEKNYRNVKRIVALLNLLRQGFDTEELSSPASVRTVFAWLEMACEMKSYEESFKWTILNRYADDAERSSVINHYKTVFNRNL